MSRYYNRNKNYNHYNHNRNVEPIATNEDDYDEYQRKMQEEDEEARAHPTPTVQYESPIGPERRPSFREKVESKARDIKENIKSAPGKAYETVKHEIGEIKRKHKENVEYEEEVERQERKVKSSPEYIKKKAEHSLYMEELRARKQSAAPRDHVNTKSANVTMGGYRSSYTGKSSVPRGGGFGGSYKSAYTGESTNKSVNFRGSYQPAYTGQMGGVSRPTTISKPMAKPISKPKLKPMPKPKPVKITMGGGSIPTIGIFGSSIPKIGGGGKRFETPMIGSGL
ncbi:MAG: hypothetical protein PHR19_08540, partial [Bacteroidales bacterium]|nr:hypothetical protein [Bacteroidales bacterium]